MNLHNQMMNLQCRVGDALNDEFSDRRIAYKTGHRDACHAAAELALAADAEIERLRTAGRALYDIIGDFLPQGDTLAQQLKDAGQAWCDALVRTRAFGAPEAGTLNPSMMFNGHGRGL